MKGYLICVLGNSKKTENLAPRSAWYSSEMPASRTRAVDEKVGLRVGAYLEMSVRFFCGYHKQICADLGFRI